MDRSARLTSFFALWTLAVYMSVGQASSLLEQATEAQWREGGSITELITSSESARVLINEVSGDIASTDDQALVVAVGDYRFVSLRGDGALALVASVDISGRGFFNNLVVLSKFGGGVREQTVAAWNLRGLGDVVTDLDGDGSMELVVPTALGQYEGTAPMPAIPRIYALRPKHGYVDSSSQFKDYYRTTVLPAVERCVQNARGTNDNRLWRALEIERAAVDAILNN